MLILSERNALKIWTFAPLTQAQHTIKRGEKRGVIDAKREGNTLGGRYHAGSIAGGGYHWGGGNPGPRAADHIYIYIYVPGSRLHF